MKITLIICTALLAISWSAWLGLRRGSETTVTGTRRIKQPLTTQWHADEEAKINAAVAELRKDEKWNEKWWKFEKLGTYGWRDGMNCGTAANPKPCMSGGYTYSPEAFEKLKLGDLSHNALNTANDL